MWLLVPIYKNSFRSYTRISFEATNGIAGFQRIIDSIIRLEKDTFAYLDNITVCGRRTDAGQHHCSLNCNERKRLLAKKKTK